MNVAVFLKEGEGWPLVLERGKITTVGEIRQMMLENLGIPKTASHVFAIWFISPHLGKALLHISLFLFLFCFIFLMQDIH